MSFSYYDDNNKLKKIELHVGSKWSAYKTESKYLNTIFSQIDDSDGIIQDREIFIVKYLMNHADKMSKDTKGNGKVEKAELKKIIDGINDNSINLGEVENNTINYINPDDYTEEALKKRYPPPKYKIEKLIFDSEIKVKIKETNQIVLDFSTVKGSTIIFEFDKKGRETHYRWYDTNGKLFREDYSLGEALSKDFIKSSKSVRSGGTLAPRYETVDVYKVKSSFIDKHIKDITPENVEKILNQFEDLNQQDLITVINKSDLKQDKKKEYKDYIERCINIACGFDIQSRCFTSQVSNKYYTGDDYDIEKNGAIVTVTNKRTSKKYYLDLKKLTKEFPISKKRQIVGSVMSLPGEVIANLCIETDIFKTGFSEKAQQYVKSRKETENASINGYYTTSNDTITLISEASQTIVHELGHAFDCLSNKGYVSKNYKKFVSAYKTELAAYLAAGHERYDSKSEKVHYVRSEGANRTSAYATANETECFAECFTYIMLGECQSADLLEDYFPNTLKYAAEIIKSISTMPKEDRHI